jgi:hypothetical protein
MRSETLQNARHGGPAEVRREALIERGDLSVRFALLNDPQIGRFRMAKAFMRSGEPLIFWQGHSSLL